MPDEQSEPFNKVEADNASVSEYSTLTSRLSFKATLAISLLVGLLLFLLSLFNYLLIHTLIELFSIVLLASVFLIGWNTRSLVRNQFFIILATGFLVTGFVDLLHTLSYKGMQVIDGANADVATQLWLIARTLAAFSFFCAVCSLGRRELFSARQWLMGFLAGAGLLIALVWPVCLFPACLIEGEGLTRFKVLYEYVLIGFLCLSALILHSKKKHLTPFIVTLLYVSLGLGCLSGLMFTLYSDVYGVMNFLGHYFKLGSVVMVYFALVEGSLRSPFSTLFRDMTQSYEELNLELKRRVSAEKKQSQARREVTFLNQMSRLMHSTLNLDELSHLTLSAATIAEAGGFERAALFTVNRRTGMLQGMLGITREMASSILPVEDDPLGWEQLHLDKHLREEQRLAEFNQKVIKQRLPLNREDNALARAFIDKKVVVVSRSEEEPSGGIQFSTALELGPYACAPMVGRDQIMGVLLVDNPLSGQEISPHRRRFLELFARQAGSALDNASLVKRLEMAHDNLQEVQEQLIHGEKMAVLGEMAAQVAHELRNPLVSIGGFAKRLSRQDLKDQKANEYADIIAREVRRLEEMLDNILSFSRKQLVCFETCRINDVLQEALDLEDEHCQRQEVQIVNQLRVYLSEIVGDHNQLRQVFLNLIINARQAMRDGGVLTITSEKGVLRGEDAVVVTVEDTGGGIRQDVMRNIFNPFFSTLPKGTGLGLSISHRIVAHHNGEIEVINGEKGARFIVTLPVHQSGPTLNKTGAT